MEEIWKPVVGYEGLYEVSNLGRVKGHKGNIMKGSLFGKYRGIILCKNSIQNRIYIHRLVLETFKEKTGAYVNHINGIKEDNRLENLEWCTPSQNCLHAYRLGLNRSSKGYSNPNSKNVLKLDSKMNIICEYGSIREAGRECKLPSNNISICCRKENRKAGGCYWRYKFNF